jgi:MFS family permease
MEKSASDRAFKASAKKSGQAPRGNIRMTSTTAAPASSETKQVRPYAWFVLAFLCFVYIFNFLDRQLMSVLTNYIKEDLGLTDSQMGLMTGLFFALFYTLLGVVAGWLADRSVRVWILAGGAFVWSLFTLLCGRANSFPVMATARMGVGVGEACGAPPSYSIVSDYFPAHMRGNALAIFSLGVPFGMALGAYLGPTIADAYGWRMAFTSIGLAGMVASILLFLFVREPKRGAMDQLDVHMEEAPSMHLPIESFGQKLNQFFGRPMLLTAAVGCGMAAFVGYAVLNWTVPFLQRQFGPAEFKAINLGYSLMLATSMGLGTWLSGRFVDILVRRSTIWYALLPAAALTLAVPFFIGFVAAKSMIAALAFLAVPTFLNIFYLAPALALVQNSVKANQRTMAGAMLLLVLNLIGLGGGPTFIGIMSDHFNGENLQAVGLTVEACKVAVKPAGCAPASAAGLQHALFWLTPFYVVGIVALMVEAMAVRREAKNGPPSGAQIIRNAKIVKLVLGFGGIAVILIAEQLLFGEPLTRDLHAISGIMAGEPLSPVITNGLVRDLLMALLALVAISGVVDALKKPKPVAA